jgi:hypothetical protein
LRRAAPTGTHPTTQALHLFYESQCASAITAAKKDLWFQAAAPAKKSPIAARVTKGIEKSTNPVAESLWTLNPFD